MGHSWSSKTRHQNPNNHQNLPNPSPPQPQNPTSSSSIPSSCLPQPIPQLQPPPPAPPPQPVPPPPPPPPPPTFAFAANAPYPTHPPHFSAFPHHPNSSIPPNFVGPMMGRSNFHPFYANQGNGWPGFWPPAAAAVVPPPPPVYVDHQSAKKVKNDVNVHKDSIRVEVDERNPDCHLVSFTFDALLDGSITIFYFGKEGTNCTFTPKFPEIYKPLKIPFKKGHSQKFSQPSGTGIDLGFFDLNDLSKPSPKEDVFPLVISAETCSTSAQITQVVLEKSTEGPFKVRVVTQILWVDGVRYELREIYGIREDSNKAAFDGNNGKECVICMTDPKDTTVLPCRHMCMCSECAKALRLQSNKCPICRQPIQELMEIKVS